MRLEALLDSPMAFGSSHADAAAFPDAVWRERAAREAGSEACATFVACDAAGAWVGMASTEPLTEVPDHVHVHAVYVSPAHRGHTGPAGRLVDAAVRFARDNTDASWLTLGVHESNERALTFYRRLGFEATGKVVPHPLDPAERLCIMGFGRFRVPDVTHRSPQRPG
ncbi:GNAT family N-acetyltransferase [Streptoverticillium reticulum]|uniref:GNAT family N-acetyltransferase n=1 Tax=Streptoverticillium reticulum TaxID=1433415 RepID=UPI0039BF738C